VTRTKNLIPLIVVVILNSCATFDTYERYGGKHLYLKSDLKELFWFSGIHNSDPNHRMFTDIERSFELFSPNCVLVEGGSNIPSESKEEAIIIGGEPRFVAYLAFTKNIPVYDIEPPFESQIGHIKSLYSDKDIVSMFLIRQLYQKQCEYKDNKRDIDYLNYIRNFLFKTGLVADGNLSEAMINSYIEPYIGWPVTESNWHKVDYGSIIYFNKTPNIVNEIWKEIIKYRDDYCVQFIENISRKYSRIFIMMGADHIKNQEERLKKIFK